MTVDAETTRVLHDLNLLGPLKIGDVVRLKSGGPSMTVRSLDGEFVDCEWFSKGELYAHPFPLQMIVKTSPEQLPVFVIYGDRNQLSEPH